MKRTDSGRVVNLRASPPKSSSSKSLVNARDGSGILLLAILAAASMISCYYNCSSPTTLWIPFEYMQQQQQQNTQQQQNSLRRVHSGHKGKIVSDVTLIASPSVNKPSSTSNPDEIRYNLRFSNVMMTADSLTVYYDADKFTPPTSDLWVNWQYPNHTVAKLPTLLLPPEYQDKTSLAGVSDLDIRYVAANKQQPRCSSWVDGTAYLVQTANYQDDMQVWREALLGAFQTLRDTGSLPLVRIDAAGNIKEVTEGKQRPCTYQYDFSTKKLVTTPTKSCPTSLPVKQKRCSPNVDVWCKPGVWSYKQLLPLMAPEFFSVGNTNDNPNYYNPVLIKWKDRAVPQKLHHLLEAISPDVRLFESGTCFTDLIIGSSRILNWQESVEGSVRQEAIQVLKDFLESADKVWVAQKRQVNTRLWMGYKELGMAWLRQGVSPTDGFTGGVLSMNDGESYSLDEKAVDEVESLKTASHSVLKKVLAKKINAGNSKNSARKYGDEDRSVVTYMTRRVDKSRAVLNEQDIIRYILQRYNVTLKVTTLQESLSEIITLMDDTDVLIGMYGTGWINSLFVRPGTVCLEMLPYGWGQHWGAEAVVAMTNSHYQRWVNTNKDHAFFRMADSAMMNVDHTVHPKKFPKGWELWFDTWHYQHTWVDMAEFGPEIDNAMKAAGIQPL